MPGRKLEKSGCNLSGIRKNVTFLLKQGQSQPGKGCDLAY